MLIGVLFDAVLYFAGLRVAAKLLGVTGLHLLHTRADSSASRGRIVLARLAGPLAIYLVAVGLFFAGSRLVGKATNSVSVVPGSPAANGGLRDGDRVVAVDGAEVSAYQELRERLEGAGARIELSVAREGQTSRVVVTRPEGAPIGLAPGGEFAAVPLSEALVSGLGAPFRAIASTATSTTDTMTGTPSPPAPGGPVALVEASRTAAPASRTGPVLQWIASVCASVLPLFIVLALVSMRRVRATR